MIFSRVQQTGMCRARALLEIGALEYKYGHRCSINNKLLNPSIRRFSRAARLLANKASPGLLFSNKSIPRRFDVICCHASTSAVPSVLTTPPVTAEIGFIPEPPMIPVETELIAQIADHSLRGLGLGSYYHPVGWIQLSLDFIHAYTGLPWWGTIVVASIVMRALLVPIMVLAQQNAARLHNTAPETQRLQRETEKARRSGDAQKIALLTFEQQIFMKENGINPLNQMKVLAVQGFVFISYFWALRKMALLKVDGMTTGGLLWFQDLTVMDPTFILPIVSCLTISAVIEVGTDSGVQAATLGKLKWVLRLMPLCLFFFIKSFPAAILCYWIVSNSISLLMAILFRVPAVRNYLGIQALKVFPKTIMPGGEPKPGFVQSFRQTLESNRIAGEVAKRAQMDAERFRAAGKGKIPKTYAFDPRKMRDLIEKGPESISDKQKSR